MQSAYCQQTIPMLTANCVSAVPLLSADWQHCKKIVSEIGARLTGHNWLM